MSQFFSQAARRLAAQLLDATSASKGAALVKLDDLAYPAGSVGAQFMLSRSPAEIAAGVTVALQNRRFDELDVRRYGAVFDGATNDAAAWSAALSVLGQKGGVMWAPPRPTLVNSQLTMHAAPQGSWKIEGWGCEMFSGAAVTGSVLSLRSGFSPFRRSVAGLSFNHRGNANAASCIEARGCTNLKIEQVSVAMHGTKANYAAFVVGPLTPGDDDSNSFWTTFDNCSFRPFSGADGTPPAYCVRLEGSANATTFTGNNFSTGAIAVALRNDGVGTTLANGVLLDGNHFEGVGIAVDALASPIGAGGYWPTGLRMVSNRAETTTTFLNLNTTDNASAANDHSQPPLLHSNYLVGGSVPNYLLNPRGALVQSADLAYYGPVSNVSMNANGSYTVRMASGNFVIGNGSNNSTWNAAHLVMGAFHLWVDGSNRLRIKNGAPASDTDGLVVGTQA